MLEGNYTEKTTFAANDHRRHRPRSWLVNGLKKIRTLDFLTTGCLSARQRSSGSSPSRAL